MNLKSIVWFLLVVLCGNAAYGQSQLGTPDIKNFTPIDYGHIGKVWDIASAPNGLVYFSTDFGLVEYDGEVWKKFKGSKGFVRSLMVMNDSTIYTGSDLDFGIWKRNDHFEFEYRSLYPFKEDQYDISEEFWDIQTDNGAVLFVSAANVYLYKEQQLTKLQSTGRIEATFKLNDTIYFALENGLLSILDNNNIVPLDGFPRNSELNIRGVFKMQDGLGIVTQKSGLFSYSKNQLKPVNSPLSSLLKTANVFCFEITPSNHFAFGTVFKGMLLTNSRGDIIHQINKQKGLLNNTILSIHWTAGGQMWLGLDYGISTLRPDSKVTYFFDSQGDFGTGYTAFIDKNDFYLGTNQGLYQSSVLSLSNANESFQFKLIKGTEGQVWTIAKINEDLLIGHDQGIFFKNGNAFEKIFNIPGVWSLVSLDSYLLAGTYNGIYIFKKVSGNYVLVDKMNDIQGSCNQLSVQHNSVLWINIPNFGIVKAELNDSIQPTLRTNFLEESFDGELPELSIENDIVVVRTTAAEYYYDAEKNAFFPLEEYIVPFKIDRLLPGVYQPTNLNDSTLFYPIYNGFALEHLGEIENAFKVKNAILIREIKAYNNETSTIVKKDDVIASTLNNVLVKWTVPFVDDVLYQYRIDNSEKWSKWTKESQVNLVNLHEGENTLNLRAKLGNNVIISENLILKIDTPFYKTNWAFGFYILLALGLIFLINLWKQKLLKQQRKLMIRSEQKALNDQALKYEKEIMLIEKEGLLEQNNELKQKLREKTIELAAKAKLSNEKLKLLTQLNEKFEALKQNPSTVNVKWKEIQSLFKESLDGQDKVFEIQMDDLHQEYFQKLESQFPKLSRNDLRMCAYIKIGLDTKEIAELFNVKPSSVYISRSRLRSKLNLEAEDNLYKFLNNL